jgi:hydrogenase maturation protein HypF
MTDLEERRLTGLGATPSVAERWRFRVTGVVQGVGFRPFVYRLAIEHRLSGWVLNDPRGVLVEAQGNPAALAAFGRALRDDAPPLARVVDVRIERGLAPAPTPAAFEIRHSVHAGDPDTIVPPDSHVCRECLREVFDPADRRYRYPFTNCTHCGPRYSLIQALPYDRGQTTMSVFTMCADCRREYEDPLDRRYHAQPNACPVCGPRLHLASPDGGGATGDAALVRATQALAAGMVVAVKSVGGFHLAVNARDAAAVARLRARKRRDAKPFALMVADVASAARFADFGAAEIALLESPARPIVLVRKVAGGLPEAIAPRNPNLGIMLPSAPLHHLLLEPPETDVLVMTSGNVSGYPIAYRNEDALAQLFAVADLVLYNDRSIEIRVDDSVMRCSTHPALDEPLVTFVRRSRGFAPYPVDVGEELEPLVAYGAELKTTVALTNGRRVYVSQHIGDLKNDETFESHQRTAEHLAALHALEPRFVACDLHPAFRATRFALADDRPVFRVQHHHAHMASCMAENRLSGPTLGVVFDGAGYGEDDTVWGGEFLLGDYADVRRVAHLRHLPLLGGDKAVYEPIRTGFAVALDTFGDADAACTAFPVLTTLESQQRHVFATMARRGINAPVCSSMGRLFDAVAALLGLCSYAEYEAHGPIELEGLLQRELTASPDAYAFDALVRDDVTVVDPRPVVTALADDLARGVPPPVVSRRFHSAVVAMVVARCEDVRRRFGVGQVVVSGGVFLNEFLLVNCLVELRARGFEAYCQRLVPTNDGGISLGQVMVAQARLRRQVAVDGQQRTTDDRPADAGRLQGEPWTR